MLKIYPLIGFELSGDVEQLDNMLYRVECEIKRKELLSKLVG